MPKVPSLIQAQQRLRQAQKARAEFLAQRKDRQLEPREMQEFERLTLAELNANIIVSDVKLGPRTSKKNTPI